MTDWIEHTGDTCPVDPETVVEVRSAAGNEVGPSPAVCFWWTVRGLASITHYRIITPAKPPEPEMPKTHEDYTGPTFGVPPKPEPDFIALRLECLKLAVTLEVSEGCGVMNLEQVADRFLRYAIDGSVDKA
jgi:hypothetical protein